MKLPRAVSSYAIFIAIAIEVIVLALATDTFLTAENLMNVLRQISFPAIVAAGMTFVILTGGIDLSVGAVVGLSGVVCAGLLAHGVGVAGSLAGALGLGLGIGLVNGVTITQLKVP